MTYKEWKQANKSNLTNDILAVMNFGAEYPAILKQYKERKRQEEVKRSEIMAIKDSQKRREAIGRNMELFEQ